MERRENEAEPVHCTPPIRNLGGATERKLKQELRMGLLDKIKGMASKNADKVSDGMDKAVDMAKDKTGGKFDGAIDKAADMAEDELLDGDQTEADS